MSNVLVMAKKEFVDLANSRLVILIMAFYILIFSLSFYNYYGTVDVMNPDADFFTYPAGDTLSIFTIIICYYGSLVAVVLGFSSMSGEADGKALNTLLVKPLYRDTIINGKLLGTVCFAFCIFWVSVAIYISVLLWF